METLLVIQNLQVVRFGHFFLRQFKILPRNQIAIINSSYLKKKKKEVVDQNYSLCNF